MPPPPVLPNLAFLLQAGEHPVEVGGRDAHLRGEFGGRDARLSLHEGERLRGACGAAFGSAGAAFGGATGFTRRFRRSLCGCGCGFCGLLAPARASRTPAPAAADDGSSGLRANRTPAMSHSLYATRQPSTAPSPRRAANEIDAVPGRAGGRTRGSHSARSGRPSRKRAQAGADAHRPGQLRRHQRARTPAQRPARGECANRARLRWTRILPGSSLSCAG